MNANLYVPTVHSNIRYKANKSLPRLAPAVVEEIFDRCLLDGSRRLYFQEFEKAMLMLAMLFFPGAHAACAYVSLVDRALIFLPSLRQGHVPDSNLDRLAEVADAVLEKSAACTFRPPSLYCSECTWPSSPSPSHRRKPQMRAESAIALATSPVLSTEVSKSQPTDRQPATAPSVAADKGSVTRRRMRPPRRSVPEEDEIPVPTKRNVHETACDFEDILVRHFGSPEIAFQFLDSSTGNPSGLISTTKFRYCCKALQLDDAEMRPVFAYIDFNGDGVIDESEFRSWRSVREKQRNQHISTVLPNNSS
jgi:hypothetical protein